MNVRQGCTVEGCERPHHGRGFCRRHYFPGDHAPRKRAPSTYDIQGDLARGLQAMNHRASVANAYRRADQGQQVPQCDLCRTELDVPVPAHSVACERQRLRSGLPPAYRASAQQRNGGNE